MSADRRVQKRSQSDSQEVTRRSSCSNHEVKQARVHKYAALDEAIAAAEKSLGTVVLPANVWYEYGLDTAFDEAGARLETSLLLGLALHLGRWRIVHVTSDRPDHDDYDGFVPLVECPPAVRLRAAKAIRDLRVRIIEAATEYAPRLDSLIAELTEIGRKA